MRLKTFETRICRKIECHNQETDLRSVETNKTDMTGGTYNAGGECNTCYHGMETGRETTEIGKDTN